MEDDSLQATAEAVWSFPFSYGILNFAQKSWGGNGVAWRAKMSRRGTCAHRHRVARRLLRSALYPMKWAEMARARGRLSLQPRRDRAKISLLF
jgi:hypothetical protein